jgi:glycopeptide antibiotics resistance protein
LSRRLARALLVAWILVILFIVVPWGRFQDHSHWARVNWIPFGGWPFRPRDIVLNVLFYMPFGYLQARLTGHQPWLRAGLPAFALSTATEFTQVFSHGRFPSINDVICNVLGALAGIALSNRSIRSSRAIRSGRSNDPNSPNDPND